MLPRNDKVNILLEKHGYTHPQTRPISLIPHKESPYYIEQEQIKFERNQIIKKHNILKNKQNKAYTNYYLDTISTLLSSPPKHYFKKRNELTLKTSKDIFLPQMTTSQKRPSLYTLSTINTNDEPQKILYFSTETIKPSKKVNKYDRMVDIEHTSNKMNKVYCKNFKKLLLRRIENVKKINVVNLMKSSSDAKEEIQDRIRRSKRRCMSVVVGKKKMHVNKTIQGTIKGNDLKKKLMLRTLSNENGIMKQRIHNERYF